MEFIPFRCSEFEAPNNVPSSQWVENNCLKKKEEFPPKYERESNERVSYGGDSVMYLSRFG